MILLEKSHLILLNNPRKTAGFLNFFHEFQPQKIWPTNICLKLEKERATEALSVGDLASYHDLCQEQQGHFWYWLKGLLKPDVLVPNFLESYCLKWYWIVSTSFRVGVWRELWVCQSLPEMPSMSWAKWAFTFLMKSVMYGIHCI